MPMVYKIDVLDALKAKGFNTYRIKKDKLFGETTVQKFRNKARVDWQIIEKLCKLLECQPGDILGYEPDDE